MRSMEFGVLPETVSETQVRTKLFSKSLSSTATLILALVVAGTTYGQGAGSKVVPVFSLEPNVIKSGAASTVAATITNANAGSAQTIKTGEIFRITLNQPGVTITHFDALAIVRSSNLAPSDFQLSYTIANGQVLQNDLTMQYVGAEKPFSGGGAVRRP